jgi:hypothetical protein
MTDRDSRPGPPSRKTRRKFSNPELDEDLADRVRDVVRGMRENVNPAYTLRQFVEEAYTAHCRTLEERYHHAKPWPHVAAPLDPGRPGTAEP